MIRATFIAVLTFTLGSVVFAASAIPVHLDPATDSPQIGELESLSLAVPAEWPLGSEVQEGWKPVFYRGVFEVYLDNNDVSKDLTAKPGSLYHLAPDKSAAKLAIATAKDKVDIISVDTWFCKMQLETIVVGYIQDTSVDANSIINSLPEPEGQSDPAKATKTAITELVGKLDKVGLIGKRRTGMSHKLVGPNGKTLAFLETSDVPERIQIEDYIGQRVRVSGFLKQTEDSDDVILLAKSLKTSN